MNDMPLLLKPKELCSIYGASVKTIYAMLYRRQIPGAFQIGRCWYINKQVLLADLEKKSALNQRSVGKSFDSISDRHGIA
ncbi:MAG: hypothetical protein A2475_03905 [Ignavibacteria bacterium RIFOXYC2_FULL_35_21]|nr:MAG: hypothetical protein A2220_02965 [Ignavibacteria bacterium RIFOXYA2_FULL_35_10]OGV21707.1 MAG: hypothetical protein A2475_03905 [Ignavibacteria bacterium RIFOXYC2_FULL_35_21]